MMTQELFLFFIFSKKEASNEYIPLDAYKQKSYFTVQYCSRNTGTLASEASCEYEFVLFPSLCKTLGKG